MKENYGKRILHGTGSVWVSEEEIVDGFPTRTDGDLFIRNGKIKHAYRYIKGSQDKKIIAQTNLTPALDGIAHIELPEEKIFNEDISQLHADFLINDLKGVFKQIISDDDLKNLLAKSHQSGIRYGYKAASKDKKYSENQVKKIAITIYQNLKRGNDFDGLITEAIKLNTPKSNEDIIGAELVMEEYWTSVVPNSSIGTIHKERKPKTYLNKSGQTCFEVKFDYK